ncbi:hypothetical protein [Fulvimarina sp. MAC8]
MTDKRRTQRSFKVATMPDDLGALLDQGIEDYLKSVTSQRRESSSK